VLSLAGYFVSWQQSVFLVKANANLIGNVNNQSSKHYGDSKVMDLQGRSENSTIAKLVKRKNKFSIFWFCVVVSGFLLLIFFSCQGEVNRFPTRQKQSR
jgi:hypothetical protein